MKKKINYKKLLKYILTFVIVLGVIFLFTNNTVLADVGNNNRYDSGSDSSSSGDGSSIFYLIYILFDLMTDIFGPFGIVIAIAILVIVFFVISKSGKLSKIKNNVHNSAAQQQFSNDATFDNGDEVANKIREIDPNFSKDKFVGWAREVFIKIQEAWTARDWKTIRPFESEELFSQHNTQLNEYINNNKINVVEKINISHCSLKEFNVDGDKEVLVVRLNAIMRDYVIDATTKKVIESDPNQDWFMNYEMVFNRKKGVKTEAGLSNKSTTNCPNCGAPTEITSAGQCDYCKSVITTGEHDWVLTDIHSIK